MTNMKLELCTASIEAIKIAKELNFDRIELCQNLEQGGITPSLGMINYALESGVDTHVLVRPRPGGFIYERDEIDIMLRNIIICGELGASGIVIGALNKFGEIDKEVLALMLKKSKGMDVTFHRAFDDTIDYKKSLDTLIELGVRRVLSSGLALNVDQGMNNLRDIVEYAEGRIEIMIGGGVNLRNISKIVEDVRPDAVHFSGTRSIKIDEGSIFSTTVLKINKKKVEELHSALI